LPPSIGQHCNRRRQYRRIDGTRDPHPRSAPEIDLDCAPVTHPLASPAKYLARMNPGSSGAETAGRGWPLTIAIVASCRVVSPFVA
jgi:hypothetical protein